MMSSVVATSAQAATRAAAVATQRRLPWPAAAGDRSQRLRQHRPRASSSYSSPSGNAQNDDTQTGKAIGITERVAARVAERNSWPTWIEHTPSSLYKFYRTEFAPIPPRHQLDEAFPVQKVDWGLLKRKNQGKDGRRSSSLSVTWIGHSTCLLRIDGFTVLTDPVFSDRCSPVQWFGPKRYRDPACSIEELFESLFGDDDDDDKNGRPKTPLVVVVSHNHYDHLDYKSVREITSRASTKKIPLIFFVPLGLADWFRSNVPNANDAEDGSHAIVELDWHETHSVVVADADADTIQNRLEVTAVPMQHWSNRTGFDKDKTLWCGYSMKTYTDASLENEGGASASSASSVLFPGDTGWFGGLEDIGKEHGPYDVAMIPIGAYEPNWFMKPQHTNPSDALDLARAVRAARAVPIHWGTFQLTTEPCMEPIRRLAKEMETEESSEDVRAESAEEGAVGPSTTSSRHEKTPASSSLPVLDYWRIGETVVVH